MHTDEVLTLLQEVADEVVVPRFRALGQDERSRKSLTQQVTVADREAEVLIARRLRAAYADAFVLGEEAAAADPRALERFRAAPHAFTVDPVDGTRQFVRGSPDHALMVAEVRGGQVVRSWIWQPQHRAAYVAERGAGAWRDGVRLRCPAPGVDVQRLSDRRWPGRAWGVARALRPTWTCCGVDYPRIVTGAADFGVYLRPKPWDHAPGSLLLAEAGGHVGTLAGGEYRPQDPAPRGLVAAAGPAAYELVRGVIGRLP